jgi:drug/metabolite transporter (DMT)-like permease
MTASARPLTAESTQPEQPARPTSAALPLIAAGVTMVFWASAFIGIRAVGAHYSPGALAFGRLAVGALALSVVALVWRVTQTGTRGAATASGATVPPAKRRRALGLMIVYGVLWFGLYTLSLNAAEQHLDAGTSSMLVAVGPILIAIFAGIFLREGFPRSLITGLAVGVVGLVIIGVATSTGQRDATGVLLGLAAAALYAIGVLLQKRVLAVSSAVPVTWLGCLAGAVACAPFAPDLLRELGTAPAGATWGIVYLGLFPTALAFLTWGYALARTSAGKLASSSYVVPALSVLMSWLLLDEVPGWLALVGGAICLVGVAITRLPARPRRA